LKLFLFLTFFISRTCVNEFLSLRDVAWVNKVFVVVVVVVEERERFRDGLVCTLGVRPNRKTKAAFSYSSGVMWTGPLHIVLQSFLHRVIR